MGSRGAMLESGGFKTPNQWHTDRFINGVKVLVPNDSRNLKLPGASNTPGTKYLLFSGVGFKQLRIFKKNCLPKMDIDYHMIDGKLSLHKHIYIDGKRGKDHIPLTKEELTQYKPYFKGGDAWMKNMTFDIFKNLLFVDGNDIEFEYNNVEYTLNLMDMKICVNRNENGRMSCQYFSPDVKDWNALVDAFLKAPLFDGKCITDIEKNITVTFTAFDPQ